MAKGWSGTSVVCLCALWFFVGCFVQQLPGLPDVSSGFSKSGSRKGLVQRRQVAELEIKNPDDVTLSEFDAPSYGPDVPSITAESLPKSFDEAVDALLPPPLEPGNSGANFYTTQPYQLLSWYPRLYVFPKFIDDERCDHIVKIALDKLGPSSLAFRKTDKPEDSVDVRTSSGTFMTRHQDPAGVLAWVEEKISAVTHLPVANGEPFNILRYNLGQHYDSHYDVFDPAEYGPQESNRKATVLFYLTDVEEGGETVFPFEGVDGMSRKATFNYKSCDTGYRYKPRKGDAVLFYSIHPNGTFDGHSLHGGCPVKKGMKMVMTRWIRDQCHGQC